MNPSDPNVIPDTIFVQSEITHCQTVPENKEHPDATEENKSTRKENKTNKWE